MNHDSDTTPTLTSCQCFSLYHCTLRDEPCCSQVCKLEFGFHLLAHLLHVAMICILTKLRPVFCVCVRCLDIPMYLLPSHDVVLLFTWDWTVIPRSPGCNRIKARQEERSRLEGTGRYRQYGCHISVPKEIGWLIVEQKHGGLKECVVSCCFFLCPMQNFLGGAFEVGQELLGVFEDVYGVRLWTAKSTFLGWDLLSRSSGKAICTHIACTAAASPAQNSIIFVLWCHCCTFNISDCITT